MTTIRSMLAVLKRYQRKGIVCKYHFEPSEINSGASVWVALSDGIRTAEGAHSIHADTATELSSALKHVFMCHCEDCKGVTL